MRVTNAPQPGRPPAAYKQHICKLAWNPATILLRLHKAPAPVGYAPGARPRSLGCLAALEVVVQLAKVQGRRYALLRTASRGAGTITGAWHVVRCPNRCSLTTPAAHSTAVLPRAHAAVTRRRR